MSKIIRIVALLLIVMIALTGCKAPEATDADETPTPTPSPTPTPPPPAITPVPTITPLVFDGEVITPAPGTTAVFILPVDKPEFEFKYEEKTNGNLGISYEVPIGWVELTNPDTEKSSIAFEEPFNNIQSRMGIPASVTISVNSLSSTQTIDDAANHLNDLITQMRAEFGSMDTSSQANNRMMGEMGVYVTFWVAQEVTKADGTVNTVRMRGRLLVVPKNNRLYMLRYMCPADFNSDYEEVFKHVRDHIKEIA